MLIYSCVFTALHSPHGMTSPAHMSPHPHSGMTTSIDSSHGRGSSTMDSRSVHGSIGAMNRRPSDHYDNLGYGGPPSLGERTPQQMTPSSPYPPPGTPSSTGQHGGSMLPGGHQIPGHPGTSQQPSMQRSSPSPALVSQSKSLYNLKMLVFWFSFLTFRFFCFKIHHNASFRFWK